MTADLDDIEAMQIAALQPDKMEMHYRQQLSAMLDGELAPDQARFLLRRLEHDHALASRWARWELCGEVMRGRAEGLLPRDFATQVMAAIDDETQVAPLAVTSAGAQRSFRRWGGAALAASVAMVALLVGRQTPQTTLPGDDAQVQMASSTMASAPIARVAAGDESVGAIGSAAIANGDQAPAGSDTGVTAAGALLASAVAVSEVPRRASTRRSNRSQAQRAATRAAAIRNTPAVVVASAAPAGQPAVDATAGSNPFLPQAVQPPRPWPRASVPNLRGGVAAVTVGLGDASPSFYPFDPRHVQQTPEDASATTQASDDVAGTP